MDEVLLPYLQATGEAKKQECLDEFLLVHASPVVRNTLRERLGIHVSLARQIRKSVKAGEGAAQLHRVQILRCSAARVSSSRSNRLIS